MKQKKKIKLTLVILAILLYIGQPIAKADDNNMDSSEESWESLDKKFGQYKFKNDTPVTQDQFDRALEVRKMFEKNGKTKEAKVNPKANPKKSNEIPGSTLPLLRLPYTVYYGNTAISDGFYLADKITKEGKDLIKITMSGNNFEFPAQKSEETIDDATSAAKFVQINNQTVKIIVKNGQGIFESTLMLKPMTPADYE